MRQQHDAECRFFANGIVGPIAGLTGVNQTYYLLPKLEGELRRHHHLSAVPVGKLLRDAGTPV